MALRTQHRIPTSCGSSGGNSPVHWSAFQPARLREYSLSTLIALGTTRRTIGWSGIRHICRTLDEHYTKSGGWHLLFKHRAGLKNTSSKLAKGVDTRGNGGYVIWWPFHLGLSAPHKLDLPLADLPDELYDQLTSLPELSVALSPCRPRLHGQRRGRVDGLLSHLQRAGEGERNSMLFWCASRITDIAKTGELGRSEITRALQSLAGAAHQTGLSIKEIERTINSATGGQR